MKMRRASIVIFVTIFLFGCHKDRPILLSTGLHSVTTFTIPAKAVVLNPTGNAPLSALVSFTSPAAGYTIITVKGIHGSASDVVQTFTDSGTYHTIPILGLYINRLNTVNIAIVDSKKDTAKATFTIQTLPLVDSHLPSSITIDFANMANMQSGFNLVSNLTNYTIAPQLPYMIDSYGDIRWCLDFVNNPALNGLFYDCGIDRLADGNYRFVDLNTATIYEMDVLGKVIHTWSMGNYIPDHDLYEKPNGNFLVTCSQPGSTHTDGTPTNSDYIIEIDRTSGAIVNTWDLKVSLDEYRQTLTTSTTDWVHHNGLIYDPSDNTIIVSGRTQCVVKLTSANQVKWILAPHEGWGKNRLGQDLNQYLLTPLDSLGNAITDTSVVNGWVNGAGFEWNWYQHAPQLMPNHDLLIFDNGTTRNYNNNQPHYSRAVEYRINEANMTVQQIWEYGKERGLETYAAVISSVKYMPDNHMLFAPGYDVQNSGGYGGKIVEVDYATKAVVFQASINSADQVAWHRVQRWNIYPNGNPYVN
jgi:arylsulfate sulfotransferase